VFDVLLLFELVFYLDELHDGVGACDVVVFKEVLLLVFCFVLDGGQFSCIDGCFGLDRVGSAALVQVALNVGQRSGLGHLELAAGEVGTAFRLDHHPHACLQHRVAIRRLHRGFIRDHVQLKGECLVERT